MNIETATRYDIDVKHLRHGDKPLLARELSAPVTPRMSAFQKHQ